MRSTVIEPTVENLADSIIDNKLKRNDDEVSFLKYLREIEGPYTIAVDGRWGTGKTFYIKEANLIMNYLWKKNTLEIDSKVDSELPSDVDKQLKSKIEAITLEVKELKQFGIYYDAWKNDYQSNPLFSLILSIVEQTNLNFQNSNINFLKSAASVLLLIAQVMAGPYSELFEMAEKLFDTFRDVKNDIKENDILNAAKSEKQLDHAIQEFFSQLSNGLDASRVVIFIDELDRCNPEFAVRLLEQLKHYLRHENITFVLSVDTLQLQHTIKKFYGEGYDGALYIDKMVDDKIFLREIRSNELLELAGHQSNDSYSKMFQDLGSYFGLPLRMMEKFQIRIEKEIFPYYDSDQNKRNISDEIYFCSRFFGPILYALMYGDPNGYYRFINGKGWDILQDLMRYSQGLFNVLRKSSRPFGAEADWLGKTDSEALEKLQEIYIAVFNGSQKQPTNISGLYFTGEFKDSWLQGIRLIK